MRRVLTGVLIAALPVVGQVAAPKPKPKAPTAATSRVVVVRKAAPVSPTMLIIKTDLACELRVDGKHYGLLEPGEPRSLQDVEPGEHIIDARQTGTTDRWTTIAEVEKAQQRIVLINFAAVAAARQERVKQFREQLQRQRAPAIAGIGTPSPAASESRVVLPSSSRSNTELEGTRREEAQRREEMEQRRRDAEEERRTAQAENLRKQLDQLEGRRQKLERAADEADNKRSVCEVELARWESFNSSAAQGLIQTNRLCIQKHAEAAESYRLQLKQIERNIHTLQSQSLRFD